jgi:hypothetical protein
MPQFRVLGHPEESPPGSSRPGGRAWNRFPDKKIKALVVISPSFEAFKNDPADPSWPRRWAKHMHLKSATATVSDCNMRQVGTAISSRS